IPVERPAEKSLAAVNSDEAEELFGRAEQDPELMCVLFSIFQISAFLKQTGKTDYTNQPSSLIEYLLDGKADCETGSFLFFHLASLIGLPLSLGRYSNHCFLYAAQESVVIECTAFYNLRPAKKYLTHEKAYYGREPKERDRDISHIFRDRLA